MPIRPGAPVEVGLYVAKNATAFGDAFGVGKQYFSSFDQEAHAAALAADLNRRGGLAGRPVRLVFASLDLTSAQPWAVQEQAACDKFTLDNRVAIVLDLYISFYTGLDECLRKRGVPLVESNRFVQPGAWYAAAPGARFTLQTPQWDRAVSTLIERLVARGVLSPANKIGILTYDHPRYRRQVEELWKRSLRRHRLLLTDVAYVHYPTSTQDIGASVGDLQGVVLSWKTQGIDAVLDDGKIASTFRQVADSQEYRPFYGLTTYSGPYAFNGTANFRAAGIGWTTYLDTLGDPPRNAAYRSCRKVSGTAGGTNWDTDAAGRDEALVACDAFAVLEAAARLGGSITSAALTAGIARIGSTLLSGESFGMRLDARHQDAVNAYRDLAYEAGCRCMKYTSGLRSFG